MVKLMMEDDKESVRKECINYIDINSSSLPYIVMKTRDQSAKVRLEVYKQSRLIPHFP